MSDLTSRIRVAVPASSANLGPGFDCLGLALAMYNVIEIETRPEGLTVDITGEGADSLPRDESNLVVRAAHAVFERSGKVVPGLRFVLHNDIPPMSGLGSSSAAIVGGLFAANALLGDPLPRSELINIAATMEGHPDNICAAALGGLIISSPANTGVLYRRVPMHPMRVAIALPNLRISTQQMRSLLPESVTLADAVHNIGRAALVVQALAEGDFALLAQAMQDRLHVAHRAALIPGFDAAVSAGVAAGAAAVTLSGAGPAIIAFAQSSHVTIAERMVEALRSANNVAGTSWVLEIDLSGAQVVA